MKYVLPPMHTLRTFEALGRLRNFTRAAQELHLTTSAVSHQIKALESFYVTKLFQRNRRDVMPTSAGEQLLLVVGEVLQQLSWMGESLRARDSNRLSVTAPPSLASRWLMPRLSAFLKEHPEIDFKLHATPALVDVDAEGVDFGIRYGKGRWAGLRSEKLFDEYVFPVASRSYVSQAKVRKLTDLGRCVLLRDDFLAWEEWFAQAEVKSVAATHGPIFNDSSLLLQAAEAGQGVALARSILVADAIADGTLVRIGSQKVTAPGGYYLVSSSRRSDTALATQFRQWLSDTAMTKIDHI